MTNQEIKEMLELSNSIAEFLQAFTKMQAKEELGYYSEYYNADFQTIREKQEAVKFAVNLVKADIDKHDKFDPADMRFFADRDDRNNEIYPIPKYQITKCLAGEEGVFDPEGNDTGEIFYPTESQGEFCNENKEPVDLTEIEVTQITTDTGFSQMEVLTSESWDTEYQEIERKLFEGFYFIDQYQEDLRRIEAYINPQTDKAFVYVNSAWQGERDYIEFI